MTGRAAAGRTSATVGAAPRSLVASGTPCRRPSRSPSPPSATGQRAEQVGQRGGRAGRRNGLREPAACSSKFRACGTRATPKNVATRPPASVQPSHRQPGPGRRPSGKNAGTATAASPGRPPAPPSRQWRASPLRHGARSRQRCARRGRHALAGPHAIAAATMIKPTRLSGGQRQHASGHGDQHDGGGQRDAASGPPVPPASPRRPARRRPQRGGRHDWSRDRHRRSAKWLHIADGAICRMDHDNPPPPGFGLAAVSGRREMRAEPPAARPRA